MEDLRIGVIGTGGRGKLSFSAHKPGAGSRLVAGADPDPQAFAKLKEVCGPDVFTTGDYTELLAREDIEAVFICTPDFLHEEMAVAALEAGKGVYLEKPMAITIEGCDRILRTAMQTGSKLYLGHNMRHFPVVLKMKELIEKGAIGELQSCWCRHFVSYGGDAFFKDWHSEQQYSTSLLLQKGAHDIDVMHWLSNGYTQRTTGMGKLSVYNRCTDRRSPDEPPVPHDTSWDLSNWPPLEQKRISPQVDVEDQSMVLMHLDNGVQCSYMQCHYTPDSWRNYTFIGTEGRLENFGDAGACSVRVYNRRGSTYKEPDEVHYLKPLTGGHGGGDPRIITEFLAFMREGTPTNTSPVAARNAVAVGVQGAASIRNGSQPFDIPPVDPNVRAYFDGGQK